MSIALLAAVVLTVLGVGYTLYGRVVARVMGLDPENPTPANTVNDGVDFVPTRKFYLLGQHFSAIAAAGPIAGPILACQQFGWFPSILWIALGVVFIGAVHDFSSLIASVRHGAKSIAELMREHVSRRAWRAMMTFIWVALIYVIVAFTDITASTFVGITQEFPLDNVTFNAGGAVALASTLYLLLAVLMGYIQKRWNPPLWTLTVTFVPATFVLVWLSTKVSTLFVFAMTNPAKMWGLLILTYCFVASLVPVWTLLQPRGYLGGFVLYAALAVGVIGMFFGGFSVAQESFKTWSATASDGSAVPLFPFLFVTIACGACSGFHGLVCSGTTSKQISTEPDCKPVGYGAMLLEAFVALIALATIMIATPAQTKGVAPGTIYGNGHWQLSHGVDRRGKPIVCHHLRRDGFFDLRLRHIGRRDPIGTLHSAGVVQLDRQDRHDSGNGCHSSAGLHLHRTAERGAYLKYWTLFGTSNQLLAALTLLAITRWLMRTGRNYWITLAPMLFVLTVTLWALILQFTNFSRVVMDKGFVAAGSTTINAIAAFLLLLMTAIILWEARRSLGGAGKLQLEGARP